MELNNKNKLNKQSINELDVEDVQIPTSYVHNTLNQTIWNKEVLKPEIRKSLLKIAKKYYDFLKIDTKIKDVKLVGSMANFNWSKHSDIDLHLFLDFSKINKDENLVSEFFETKEKLWKELHHITVKGFDVELYTQDINEELHSEGVYSLLKDDWESKPNYKDVKIDKKVLSKKIASIATQIENLEKDKSNTENVVEKAKKLKDKIKKMRQSGLDKTGEFSIENLTFKYLRNEGYLEKLFSIIGNEVDKELTLKEGANMKKVIFKGKRNPNLEIVVELQRDGRIVSIENNSGIRFPFGVGQILNRNHEIWASNNNFLVNGKDTSPEEKIFGIRTKDIPQGHELRRTFPNKFKNESLMENEEKISAHALMMRKIAKKGNLDISRYNMDELYKGFQVEKEHGTVNPITNVTNDDEVKTLKIAMAHLNEVPDYYTKLSKYVEVGELNEKAESKSQQGLMGAVYAYKSGEIKEKDINPEYKEKVLKIADSISLKSAKDYAETKRKYLPKTVKENFETENKKNKLTIKSSVDNLDSRKKELIQKFIIACFKELEINEPCHIYLTGERGGPITTTASYNPNNHDIWIYTKNRNMLADPLRSLAHEIRHFKQNLMGEIDENSGITGSKQENEANSFSGIMIRKFGKLYPEIYN